MAIQFRRWRLSLFEKVILANSIMLVGEALAGLWITSHALEAHHYLIDTSFIVLAVLLGLLINVLLLRASFRPLFSLLSTIRAVSAGKTDERARISQSDAEISELAQTFNGMLDRLEITRREQGILILQAQEEERRRLALELHDESSQNLTALLIHIEILSQSLQALPDTTMAGMDGLEACQRIRSQVPETQVLMLTMHESEEYFLQALRMGAAGYLIKKVAPTELHMAIRAVARGGAFLYPGLAKALIRAYVADSQATPVTSLRSQERAEAANLSQELRVLTPREVEVLTLVAEGRTNQEIANQLVLSVKTVQAHRANVMEKLGLHDVTHLVRFAIRHGLIPAGP